jgi:6,7-dimethyl-8-ribityllumazine synthase
MSATGGFWPGEAPAAEEEKAQNGEGWPQPREEEAESESEAGPVLGEAAVAEAAEAKPETDEEEAGGEEEAEDAAVATAEHVPGELDIPDDVAVLEGSPSGADRTVGVVVSRFNGEISNKLLESALEALSAAGVSEERITVMPVPGAFELPFGAMALAKTRRYSCIVALGCVVRGETAHFEYVAGEAASGLQLAGLETGVPVAFGVLTVDTAEQAEARLDKGADAARAALEMADLFAQVREQAKPG